MAQSSRNWEITINLDRGLTTNVAVGRSKQYQLDISYRKNFWGSDEDKAYVQLEGVNNLLEHISVLVIDDPKDTDRVNGAYEISTWISDEDENETDEIPLHYSSILRLVWTNGFIDNFLIARHENSGGISDQLATSVRDFHNLTPTPIIF